MIDETTIRAVADLLRQADPTSRVILFGSHARGDAHEASDLDLLVVQPDRRNVIEEYVRLRLAIRPLRVPVDLIVTDAREFADWSDTPGTLYFEAAREGRVLNDAA